MKAATRTVVKKAKKAAKTVAKTTAKARKAVTPAKGQSQDGPKSSKKASKAEQEGHEGQGQGQNQGQVIEGCPPEEQGEQDQQEEDRTQAPLTPSSQPPRPDGRKAGPRHHRDPALSFAVDLGRGSVSVRYRSPNPRAGVRAAR